MRIYDIHNQHPEWFKNPRAHKDEIRDTAHAYVMDLFKISPDIRDRVLFRDLEAIAKKINDTFSVWEQERYEREKEIGELRVDALAFEFDIDKCKLLGRVTKQIMRYLEYYGYWLKEEKVEAFYKKAGNHFFEHFVSREDFPFIKVSSAKEDFANIRFVEETEYAEDGINLGDDTAKALYKELKEKKKIDDDCSEDDFLWFFGDDTHRGNKQKPNRITWKGKVKEFAYLGDKLRTIITDASWRDIANIFERGDGNKWNIGVGGLPNDASKIKKGVIKIKFKLKSLGDK